jgi:valyl-tRNA synthetase
VTAVRNLRGENLVPVGAKAKVTLLCEDAAGARFFEERRIWLTAPPQVNVSELEIKAGAGKDQDVVSTPGSGVEVCLHVAGLVDYAEEERRLQKEIGKVELELEKVEKKLSSPGFRGKAPAEIVAKQEEIAGELKERQAILEANLERVRKLLKR